MKVIDIVNDIAKEKIGIKKFKFDSKIWEYNKSKNTYCVYYSDGDIEYEFLYYLESHYLNKEIEIIEEYEPTEKVVITQKIYETLFAKAFKYEQIKNMYIAGHVDLEKLYEIVMGGENE